jgi:hypothetical protein
VHHQEAGAASTVGTSTYDGCTAWRWSSESNCLWKLAVSAGLVRAPFGLLNRLSITDVITKCFSSLFFSFEKWLVLWSSAIYIRNPYTRTEVSSQNISQGTAALSTSSGRSRRENQHAGQNCPKVYWSLSHRARHANYFLRRAKIQRAVQTAVY